MCVLRRFKSSLRHVVIPRGLFCWLSKDCTRLLAYIAFYGFQGFCLWLYIKHLPHVTKYYDTLYYVRRYILNYTVCVSDIVTLGDFCSDSIIHLGLPSMKVCGLYIVTSIYRFELELQQHFFLNAT